MTSVYTPTPVAALAAAHAVLMAAILALPCPPGPLLRAAVEVAGALEEIEDAERDTENHTREEAKA